MRDLLFELTSEFDSESDRAVVVLAAAYLDHLLGQLISGAMQVDPREVEELLYQKGNGPLGTFSARIDTAYCMGLLTSEQTRDLHLIRKIRNDYVHQLLEVSFASPPIASRARELKGAQVGELPSSARKQFDKAAVRLMVDIILKMDSLKKQVSDSKNDLGN